MGIHRGAAGRFTKQATTLPAEGNTPSAGTKAQALHRVLIGGKPILQNTVQGGNGMGGGTGTTAAPTLRGSTKWSALTESVKFFEPSAITQELLKKLLKWQTDFGGVDKVRHI